MSRQLACIVFTDIVGYTSLMGRDETQAFNLLRKNRDLQKPVIEAFNGRLLKEMGDGIMASFSTASEAVLAAIKIQDLTNQAALYQLRIGIHLGEVVFENNDVFGDGVNIASRIQSVAAPGSIQVSDTVAANVINKSGIQVRFLKTERLKNVQEPVRIYEVQAAVLEKSATVTREVNEAGLSGNGIAVMPFVNMSNDPEQEYFCDGVSEEIINALGQLNRLRVIARTSTFSFKGKALDLREIGKMLDVDSILEGSVRKAGKRVRITTQLVNASNGSRLWSNQYDRELEDIFAIQEDIAGNVATAVKGFLTRAEREVIRRPGTLIEAYEYFLKGRQLFHKLLLPEAIGMFKKAIELDSEYALAYAGMADTFSWKYEWEGSLKSDLEQAEIYSLKSISLAPNLAESRASRGYVLTLAKKFDEAQREFSEAIRLNSNCFEAYYLFGRSSFAHGDILKSAELFQKAAEVRREDFQSLLLLAQSLHLLGSDKENEALRDGITRARKQLEINPEDIRVYSLGAGSLYELGEKEEAFRWMRRGLELGPEDSGALINAACLYAKSGQKSEALDLLEKVLGRGSGNKSWILQDPDYNSLRAEPRFIALMNSMKD